MIDLDFQFFDTEHYNALPSLDRARALLTPRLETFEAFKRDAAAIVANNDFKQGELGAFLIHGHRSVGDNEMMLEEATYMPPGRAAMMTRSVHRRQTSVRSAYPSKWAAVSRRTPMLALELSSDPAVVRLSNRVRRDPVLLGSLVEVLNEYELNAVVGYAIIPRDALQAGPDEAFVETNTASASVVTAEVLAPSQAAVLVRTVWPLVISTGDAAWGSYYCGRCS